MLKTFEKLARNDMTGYWKSKIVPGLFVFIEAAPNTGRFAGKAYGTLYKGRLEMQRYNSTRAELTEGFAKMRDRDWWEL